MPDSSNAHADRGANVAASNAGAGASQSTGAPRACDAGASHNPPPGRDVAAALFDRALRGSALLGIGQALASAFGWAQTAILARMLLPAHFGLVSMATVMLGLFNVLSNLGLSEALIARKDLDDAHVDAAFWTTVLMGALLFVLSCAFAIPLAVFYREPRLAWVTVACATSLLTAPLFTTHAVLLRRRMEFGVIARVELARTVCSGVVAIAGALAGLEHWALVLSTVGGHAAGIALYRRADTSWRPRRRGSMRRARELMSFSLYVSGGAVINYFAANVDYAVVGRVLGSIVLGVYKLAYETMTFPLIRISGLVGAVMFPAFSALQDRLTEMREMYVRISRVLAFVSFPILAWIAVAAPELVVLVYGERWLSVVPILRFLSVAGALKSVGTVVGLVYRARGKVHVELYWNGVWAVAITAVVLVGVHLRGAEGVAIGISALCVPGVLFTEWLACKYLELPFIALLRAFITPALAAMASAAAAVLLRGRLEGLPPGLAFVALRLAALTIAMGVVYLAIVRVLFPPMIVELASWLGRSRRRPG